MTNTWMPGAGMDGLPLVFLVDKDGYISWIGLPSASMDSAIEFMLSPSYSLIDAIDILKKQELSKPPVLDFNKPLFIDNNGGSGRLILYRSQITQYDNEHPGSSEAGVDFISGLLGLGRAGMVQQIGAPLELLYYMAYADTNSNISFWRYLDNKLPDTIRHPSLKSGYGHFWYKPFIEVKDKTPFQYDFKKSDNRYNYSLVLNDTAVSSKTMRDIMRKDLDICFGYDVNVETRMMPCWKLIASENARKKLLTKTPKGEFNDVQLNDTVYEYHNALIKDILIRFINSFSYGYSNYGTRPPKEEAPFYRCYRRNGRYRLYYFNQGVSGNANKT